MNQGHNYKNKQGVAFYISSHGFGHLTRCLAILEAMLEEEASIVYHLICDEPQIAFAKIYLAKFNERISCHVCETDIGLINQMNSLELNMVRMNKQLHRYIKALPTLVKKEARRLKHLNISMVVTDISILGCYVGEALHVPVVGISNFTWLEQYKHLECQRSIMDAFEDGYKKLSYFLKYPIQLTKDMTTPSEEIGFVSRPIDRDKVRMLQEMYEDPVFISVGRSASTDKIMTNHQGTIFTTPGTHVISPGRIVKLHVNTLDTQNYVAASRLVIAKAGWGTIAEAVLGKTPMVLIERLGVLEDTYNIKALKESKLACSIKEVAMKHIDMPLMMKRCIWLKTMDLRNDHITVARRLLTLYQGEALIHMRAVATEVATKETELMDDERKRDEYVCEGN